MKRHVELRFLLEMAPIAKLGLRLYEQEIRFFTVVRRMARDATNAILGMLRVDCIHVLCATRVAAQAERINFFGGGFFEKEEFGGVGRISGVARCGAVTVLAAVLRDPAFLVSLLPVRAFLPAFVNVLVAGLTSFRTCITGRLRLRRTRRALFLRSRCRPVGSGRLFLRLCQSESR